MANFRLLSDDELEKVKGGYNWTSYSKCLLNNGASAIPELAPVVMAILKKDYATVAQLSGDIKIKALPIVMKCWGEGKN
ncbi:MAG: hypothetical protein Q4E33_03385 [Erysipelotrichaceae bacterium]|nr:hypothetical protein [Erysipelotrichaceae bacterium]